jgi:hypothetical protein
MKSIILLAAIALAAPAFANSDGKILLRCEGVNARSLYFQDIRTITVVQHETGSATLVEEYVSGTVRRTPIDASAVARGDIELSYRSFSRYLSRRTGTWELVKVDCDESFFGVSCTQY